MAKVIDVNDDSISIGFENGSLIEVPRSDVSFSPTIGDIVECYTGSEKTIVSLVEKAGWGSVGANNIPEGMKAVSKAVYVILAWFLGSLGIHKFYAGKTATGIIYLLVFLIGLAFSGVPSVVIAVIAFIDGIVAICKKSDSNGRIII